LGEEVADEGLVVPDHQVLLHRRGAVGLVPREHPADVVVAAHPVLATVMVDRNMTGDAEHPAVEAGVGPDEPVDGGDGAHHGLADRVIGVLVSHPADEEGAQAGVERAIEGLPGGVVTRGGRLDQATGLRGVHLGSRPQATFDAVRSDAVKWDDISRDVRRRGQDTTGTSLHEGRRYGVFERVRGQGVFVTRGPEDRCT
jgi:hypothetical protein